MTASITALARSIIASEKKCNPLKLKIRQKLSGFRGHFVHGKLDRPAENYFKTLAFLTPHREDLKNGMLDFLPPHKSLKLAF
jgi:hypothetical protein